MTVIFQLSMLVIGMAYVSTFDPTIGEFSTFIAFGVVGIICGAITKGEESK